MPLASLAGPVQARQGCWRCSGVFRVGSASSAQTAEQIDNARNTNIDANPHRIDPSGYELLGTSRPRVLPHLALRGEASSTT